MRTPFTRRVRGLPRSGRWSASPTRVAHPATRPTSRPSCAGCHSSRSAEVLEGAGERAQKELTERKHISVILTGQKNYESLTEPDRKTLADQIRALDEASTVKITAPAQVQAGATLPGDGGRDRRRWARW